MFHSTKVFILILIMTYVFTGCGSDAVTTTLPSSTPTPIAPGSTIVKGQVFNAGNNIIPDAYLVYYNLTQILSLSGPTETVTADALGNYLIDGLTPSYGRIEMWKSKSEYNSSPLNPSGSVNFTLIEGINSINLKEGVLEPFPSVLPTATPTVSPSKTATPTPVKTVIPGFPVVTDTGPSYNNTQGPSAVTFNVNGYNFGIPSDGCTVQFTEVKGLGSTPSVTLKYGTDILPGKWNDVQIFCYNVTLDTGKYLVRVTDGKNRTTVDKVYYVKGNADYDITVSK